MKRQVALAGLACVAIAGCTTVVKNPEGTMARNEPAVEHDSRATSKVGGSELGKADEGAVRKQAESKLGELKDQLRFEVGAATLTPEAASGLEELAGILRKEPDAKVEVQGFTDSTGSLKLNQNLSSERARAVADALEKGGFDPSRVTFEGRAWSDPVASNDSADGRARNRRAEVSID